MEKLRCLLLFYDALLMDLIGAPEFLAGVYLARLFRLRVAQNGSPLFRLCLGTALFVGLAVAGTGLRTLLFGTPSPGFASFGFGVTAVADAEAN